PRRTDRPARRSRDPSATPWPCEPPGNVRTGSPYASVMPSPRARSRSWSGDASSGRPDGWTFASAARSAVGGRDGGGRPAGSAVGRVVNHNARMPVHRNRRPVERAQPAARREPAAEDLLLVSVEKDVRPPAGLLEMCDRAVEPVGIQPAEIERQAIAV